MSNKNLEEVELNPGIRKWVYRLSDEGFFTVDSGDGETHDHDCDREHGYVTILVPAGKDVVDETNRIALLLESWDVKLGPMTMEGPTPDTVYVQCNYSPIDGLAFIDIQGCHDRMFE